MGIHEPRDEHVLLERNALISGKARSRLRHGQHGFDLAVAYRDGVLGENAGGRLDWNEPARLDK
jgi:hypothetical protein